MLHCLRFSWKPSLFSDFWITKNGSNWRRGQKGRSFGGGRRPWFLESKPQRPTHVASQQAPVLGKTKENLFRFLDAEQSANEGSWSRWEGRAFDHTLDRMVDGMVEGMSDGMINGTLLKQPSVRWNVRRSGWWSGRWKGSAPMKRLMPTCRRLLVRVNSSSSGRSKTAGSRLAVVLSNFNICPCSMGVMLDGIRVKVVDRSFDGMFDGMFDGTSGRMSNQVSDRMQRNVRSNVRSNARQ